MFSLVTTIFVGLIMVHLFYFVLQIYFRTMAEKDGDIHSSSVEVLFCSVYTLINPKNPIYLCANGRR